MKDIDGMMFLRKLQADNPQIVSIMMTAFGSIDTAIQAMKAGAYHYIVKPFKNEEMLLLVKRALERASLTRENRALKKELRREISLETMVGKSAPMVALFDLVKRVAPATAHVLITGESGTGKELVARSIHKLSGRSKEAFVPINCTAIPETLLESELFGHVKGAFTGAVTEKKGLFEAAQGGTLFLDEIGDLSLALQAKLLRVLQDKEIRPVGGNQTKSVDVRIVSATHRHLKTLVQEGKFREDLFYRLNVLPVPVPALREREGDVLLMAEHFVARFARENNSNVKGLTPKAKAKLMAYHWHGNVRELENTIERAVVLCPNTLLDENDVMGTAVESAKESFNEIYSDHPTLEKLEERYIKLVLAQVEQKKDAAAKILGINRRTLYRKERHYGLIEEGVPEPENIQESE
jgi:DNA-binding NtrC family response regulator